MLVQEGVRDDSAFKVTREVELNLARDGNVLGAKVGQHSPLVLTWAVTDPVGELVGARVSGLNVGGGALSSFRCLSHALSDVVAALGTVDLTPESQFGGAGSLGKVLHRLLEEHGNLLTKANVSPLVNRFVVLNEVGHVANGCGIISSTFFSFSLGISVSFFGA